MVTRTKRAPKLIAADSTYIDPIGCDSTVSYKIVDGSRQVWGSVKLSDCNRSIEWAFGLGRGDSLLKIDKVIEFLQEFRTQYAAARVVKRKPRAVKKRTTVAG